jgi:hypothetical protein
MSLYVPYYRPYNKHNTNIHGPGGIRTHDPSKRAAEDPRLRPHGHWDRPSTTLPIENPTRTGLGSNPYLRGERPATEHMSHGRAF